MCDEHSNVIVMTRKPWTDRWCLRHRHSASGTDCPIKGEHDPDDWCYVTNAEVWHPVGVDECIAPIVEALNKAGAFTVASCCGHGTQPGSIVLRDGRELTIGGAQSRLLSAARTLAGAVEGEGR
jgi:hypothetical protein